LARTLYSARFIAQQGLTGTGTSIIVPAGHRYIVKQVTIYASPLLSLTAVFFQDDASGAALFASRFNLNEAGWVGFYGALCFEEGDGFHFQVDNTAGERADVYAGGYDLLT
jgi:hypothetical protein